jgi:16S rRNA (uracil1498-N3)-methyltransferase
MPRFYLPAEQWAEAQPSLQEDEARHCAQVHRCTVGQCIQVIDGQGRAAQAEILSVSKQQVALRLAQIQQPPRPHQLSLCVAVTKGESFEWIIEKAVELGVSHILPLLTERVIVRLSAADALKKQQKWQRLALEACKQCGQAWLPQVAVPQSLPALLQSTQSISLKLCAALVPDAHAALPPLPKAATHAALLIGPEGDFTPTEYQQIFAAGWLPWSLGCFTLRSETAAISSVSVLQYHLQNACE